MTKKDKGETIAYLSGLVTLPVIITFLYGFAFIIKVVFEQINFLLLFK